jgi:glycosyltransferase involved in cell wall biosynthesis
MIIVNKIERNLSEPFFTIVTVVKNGGKSLQKTIDSVKLQTFKDFEYLILDGGSTDDTLEIIRKNSLSVDYSVSRRDNGLYYALNQGIDLARGKFIGLLHSDDIYEKDALSKIYNMINTNDDASIIYGGIKFSRNQNKIFYIDDAEIYNRMIYHPSCFVKKNLYLRIGAFNTRYKIAADYEFMLRSKTMGVKFFGENTLIATFAENGLSSKHKFRSILETSIIQIKYQKKYLLRHLILLVKLMMKQIVREFICILRKIKESVKSFN